MPGRHPKPTALKQLAGNPGRRKLNKREPLFSGAPKCPSFLTKPAKAEWKRITHELSAQNMLKSVDSATLASYCQSYARWISAEAIVDAEGQTVQEPIVNKQGDIVGYKTKRHPATLISKDAQAAMHRAASLFGFDPSSRSRLSIQDAPGKDPFAAFMEELTDHNAESEPAEVEISS